MNYIPTFTSCLRVFVVWFFLLSLCVCGNAQDITTLEKIGPVVRFERTGSAVTLHCQDNSQVRLTILAPDLIRVRAAFAKAIPTRDHSWAIAKENWDTPRWNLTETSESIKITNDEI